MDQSTVKHLAEVVEHEWREWLKTPGTFLTPELLDAWSDLLETILGRKVEIEDND